MRQIAMALSQYAEDYDYRYPPAAHWADAAALHLQPADMPHVFHCPAAHSPYRYIFNVTLDRLRMERLVAPADTPLLYEQEVKDFNAFGDGTTLPPVNRHVWTNIALTDGHVKQRTMSTLTELNWKNTSVPQHEGAKR